MQAIIFAAGLGTRLKPLTDKTPKALITINGKSLLQRNIEILKSLNIDYVVINVFHFAEQIIEHLNQNKGFGLSYAISHEKDGALETGGGLKNAFSLFRPNEPILSLNADILTNYNLESFIHFHHTNKNFISLAVSNRESDRKLLFDKNGYLCGWQNSKTNETKMIFEPDNHFYKKAFSGICIFDYSIKDFFLPISKYSLIEWFLTMESKKNISSYEYSIQDFQFVDVGKIENIQKAEQFFI